MATSGGPATEEGQLPGCRRLRVPGRHALRVAEFREAAGLARDGALDAPHRLDPPRPRLSRIRHRSWGARPRLSSCVHVGPEGFSPALLRRRLVLTSGQRRHRARGRFVVASRPRSSLNGWWSWGDGRRHTSLPCPRLRAGTPRSGHEGAASGGKERAPRCEGRRAPSSVSAWSFA